MQQILHEEVLHLDFERGVLKKPGNTLNWCEW